ALASSDRPPLASRAAAPIASQRVPSGPVAPPPRRDRNRPGDGRARRFSRALVAGMAAVTLLAAAAIGYGLHQRHVASDRRARAGTQRPPSPLDAGAALTGLRRAARPGAGRRTAAADAAGARAARGVPCRPGRGDI